MTPTAAGTGFTQHSRGFAIRGAVWTGGDAEVLPAHQVVVDASGQIARIEPITDLVDGLATFGDPKTWIGPSITDAHVHLGFGTIAGSLNGGVTAVRDLGAPPELASSWQRGRGGPGPVFTTAVAGPLLTASDGYPSRSWGADGYARFIDTPEQARAAVRDLAGSGVDVIKLALEPSGGQPVPSAETAAEVVRTAHELGLPVTAHALTLAMVERALSAGVDELCHTPLEALPQQIIEAMVTRKVVVTSTLQTFFSGRDRHAKTAAANARALIAAGVPMLYGTDLGNAGTGVGIDPRELQRIAAAGLGRKGALRAATEGSAAALGFNGRAGTGRIEVGQLARLIALHGDPIESDKPWGWLPSVAVGSWLRLGGR